MSLIKKVFGVGWFDIKTKCKKTIRSFFYTKICQEMVSYIIVFYIYFVYYTSRKVFVNQNLMLDRFRNDQSLILVSWHNGIMMSPFVAKLIYKVNKVKKISSLASKHGDGRFVGAVMKKFGINNISGSSRDGRKSSRGIDIHGLKEIFRAIRSNLGIAITPDGPRGPAQKINGEIIKIAKLSATPILPMAVGYSKFCELKTWDKFRFPFPFGVICYCFDDLFFVDKDIVEQDIPALNLMLEERINLASNKADEIADSL